MRTHILPRRPAHALIFLSVLFAILVIYWFELFIVLPTLYDQGTVTYWVHFVLGHVLLVNVTSSFVGAVLVDNSVKRYESAEDIRPDWRHCNICDIKVPPRSWHCTICNTCMLKRDHHCYFTGYCVGHYNHRHFIMFMVYASISCAYATFYNLLFLREDVEYKTLILRTIFSVPYLLSIKQVELAHVCYLIFYVIIGASLFAYSILYTQIKQLTHGTVSYEEKIKEMKYNMGTKQNFINIFGERWYLSWLSPFLHSKLPIDGFKWDEKASKSQ